MRQHTTIDVEDGNRCAGGRGDMEDEEEREEGGGPHPLAANLALLEVEALLAAAPTFAVAPLHLCESLRERGFLDRVGSHDDGVLPVV